MVTITRSDINDVLVLHFTGRMDTTSVKSIKEEVRKLTEENHVKFVFDLKGVDFIDSSGLGCLVMCLRMAMKKDGDIKLCGLQKHVRSVFEVTRLHRLFAFYEDCQEAAQQF